MQSKILKHQRHRLLGQMNRIVNHVINRRMTKVVSKSESTCVVIASDEHTRTFKILCSCFYL